MITILTPVYNGERWVGAAIDSVLNQTMPDFELLIVDDGSTDGTPRVLADYAARDERIRVITQENKGISRTLNEAMPLARYDWIARLDADDLALPNRLERQLSFINANPGIAVAASDADYIDERGAVVGRHVNPFRSRAEVERWLARDQAIFFIHSAVIMRRDAILDVGGYRPEFELSHDTDLWNRVAERGHQVLSQPEVLAQYRIHEHGMTRHSFLRLIRELRWLEACIRQRRRGLPEPCFSQHLAHEARKPLLWRLNAMRRDYAYVAYKSATVSRVSGNYPALIFQLGAAGLLDPRATVAKVWTRAIRPPLPAHIETKRSR
jgi:glycosyltransferase involved in cell wall biosynthesis